MRFFAENLWADKGFAVPGCFFYEGGINTRIGFIFLCFACGVEF